MLKTLILYNNKAKKLFTNSNKNCQIIEQMKYFVLDFLY